MTKYALILLCFLIAISTIFGTISYASENTCLSCYEKMVVAMENAGSKANAGDYCGATDYIEIALNWLGTCEEECLYDKERMRKLSSYKSDLIRALALYVKKCGH